MHSPGSQERIWNEHVITTFKLSGVPAASLEDVPAASLEDAPPSHGAATPALKTLKNRWRHRPAH